MKLTLTLSDTIGGEIEARIETDEELGGNTLAEQKMGDVIEFLQSGMYMPCPVYEMASVALH